MPSRLIHGISGTLFTVLLFSLIACEGGKKQTPLKTGDQLPTSSTTALVLARINGQEITEEDVRKIVGPKLAQAERDLFEARKEGLDQIIEEKLLDTEAKRQGTTKDDLIKKGVHDKFKIGDKEVDEFYKERKDQMQGKKLDEVKSNIQGHLFRERYQKLYGQLTSGLRKKAEVEILIKGPTVEVEEGDSPAIGPKGAPVKVVEFTDYQCPFCGRVRQTVSQILEEYKGKVRYVIRDFPLSFHKDALKAHEGAHCAADQGKYWEMNKKLFADQSKIQVEDLKKYAAEIKLDTKKFADCLDSGKYTEKVRKSQEYGEKIGVSGTPAFFINGRMISGARPFEAFKEIIDDELRKD